MTQFLLTATFFLAMSVLTFAASNTLPASPVAAAPVAIVFTQN